MQIIKQNQLCNHDLSRTLRRESIRAPHAQLEVTRTDDHLTLCIVVTICHETQRSHLQQRDVARRVAAIYSNKEAGQNQCRRHEMGGAR
ncbi:hypothetical protein AMELA_G00153380 [Ameiurus melas]|uniref:Uncharacterized protein n=1 Tax=Ameiurus melas TaxID=219545 RepID=A0A7J6AI27_AMEME|nr:hypothetical protein AMELA_G00153380 [Ameiurus melas]